MKQILIVSLLFLMSAFLLAGCTGDADSQKVAVEKKEIEKRKQAYEVKELGESDIPVTTNNF